MVWDIKTELALHHKNLEVDCDIRNVFISQNTARSRGEIWITFLYFASCRRRLRGRSLSVPLNKDYHTTASAHNGHYARMQTSLPLKYVKSFKLILRWEEPRLDAIFYCTHLFFCIMAGFHHKSAARRGFRTPESFDWPSVFKFEQTDLFSICVCHLFEISAHHLLHRDCFAWPDSWN